MRAEDHDTGDVEDRHPRNRGREHGRHGLGAGHSGIDPKHAVESPEGRSPWWRVLLRWCSRVLAWLLITAGAVFIGTSLWILGTFGQVSIPQLIMNLPKGGGEGADGDPALIQSFFVKSLVIPLAVVAVAALGYYFIRWFIRARRRRQGSVRAGQWWQTAIAAFAAVAVFVGGGWYLTSTVQLQQYIEGVTGSLSMEPYYQAPEVLSAPAHPKNLVVIYLESMDEAFGEADIVGEDLLIALQESTADWAKLDVLRQYPSSGWTMAGIIGTQCGIPPRPAGGVWAGEMPDVNLIGEDKDAYLPGAICLGDILAEHGYHNVYLGGASAEFASKGSFLRTHGYETIKDRGYWEAQGETEFSGWGLSDRRLFENAKQELAELHAADRPFNLTMLTLDNHTPVHDFGYCPQTSETPTHSAIRCQSEFVADLIDFMRDSGMLEDTVVAVMADHLMMPSEATVYRAGVEPRNATRFPLFARFWTPDGIEFARTHAHQLHLYPTILELLGYEIGNHQAGLGLSLLVSSAEIGGDTLLGWEFDKLRAVLASPSRSLYDKLWDVLEEPVE